MDINAFKTEIIKELSGRLPEVTIEERPTLKKNRGTLTGLAFHRPDMNMSPALYVEDMYQSYIGGQTIEQIADISADVITDAFENAPELPSIVLDFYEDGRNLDVALLDSEYSAEYLHDKPYLEKGGGLVLTARLVSPDGMATAAIANEVMENWGITKNQLFEAALKGACEKERPVLRSLEDMIRGEGKDLLTSNKDISGVNAPLVLTTENSHNGAKTLFFPGMIEKIQDILGAQSFYIIPSSVHEVLILPKDNTDPYNFVQMIGDANRNVVAQSDVLSDDLFICEEGIVRRMSVGGKLL